MAPKLMLSPNCTFILFTIHLLALSKAATTQRTTMPSMRYPMPNNNEYLPPLPTNRQLVPETRSTANIPTMKPATPPIPYPSYTSYVPPPSGSAAFHYSKPKASQLIPLPLLLPNSVLTPQLPSRPMSGVGSQPSASPNSQGGRTSLMIEEPTRMYLTAKENQTLEAARLLASTILDNDTNDPEPSVMNATDVVIVKAQKNAYIIPHALNNFEGEQMKDLRTKNGNEEKLKELYDKREQLQKVYSINQFIFIIKPEKINFLNKLV